MKYVPTKLIPTKLIPLERPERLASLNSIKLQRIPRGTKNSIPVLCKQSDTKINPEPSPQPLLSRPTSSSAPFLIKPPRIREREEKQANKLGGYCSFSVQIGQPITSENLQRFKYNFKAWYERLYQHTYDESQAFHILDIIQIFDFPNIYKINKLYDLSTQKFTNKGEEICKLLTFFSMAMVFTNLHNNEGLDPTKIRSFTYSVTEKEFEFCELLHQEGSSFKEFFKKYEPSACISTLRFSFETTLEFAYQKQKNQKAQLIRGEFRAILSVCFLDNNFLIQPVTHFVKTKFQPKQSTTARAKQLPNPPKNWKEKAIFIFSQFLIN